MATNEFTVRIETLDNGYVIVAYDNTYYDEDGRYKINKYVKTLEEAQKEIEEAVKVYIKKEKKDGK